MAERALEKAQDVVFSACGITRIYTMGEMQIHALRGADLDLYAGKLVVMPGASGSGKSTLLNILGGLDSATAGEVLYGGQKLVQAEPLDGRVRLAEPWLVDADYRRTGAG